MERCCDMGAMQPKPSIQVQKSRCAVRKVPGLGSLFGRGNLKKFYKVLILISYLRLSFLLEYLLEYHP
jgi:hypothetical protein